MIGEAGALCVAAWRELDTTRTPFAVPVGLGGAVVTSSAIEWRAVKDWCEWSGLGKDETRIVASVLRRLDGDRARSESARIQEAARRASGK